MDKSKLLQAIDNKVAYENAKAEAEQEKIDAQRVKYLNQIRGWKDRIQDLLEVIGYALEHNIDMEFFKSDEGNHNLGWNIDSNHKLFLSIRGDAGLTDEAADLHREFVIDGETVYGYDTARKRIEATTMVHLERFVNQYEDFEGQVASYIESLDNEIEAEDDYENA